MNKQPKPVKRPKPDSVIAEVLWVVAAILLTFLIDFIGFCFNPATIKYIVKFNTGSIIINQDVVITILFTFLCFWMFYFRGAKRSFTNNLQCLILLATALCFVAYAITQTIYFSVFDFISDTIAFGHYPSIFDKNGILHSTLPRIGFCILVQFFLIIASITVILFTFYAFSTRHLEIKHARRFHKSGF